MLKRILSLSLIFAFTAPLWACPVNIQMGLNQSGQELQEFSEFNQGLVENGFTSDTTDPRFKLIFQLLKRKTRSKTSKKFAWGSVSVYDQSGKLVAYSFKKGPASKEETKAYSQKNFDLVMSELLGELPVCF